MAACAQPGCSGQIEDGYCNACGMAPVGAAKGTAPMTSTASASVKTSGRTGSTRTPTSRSGRSSRSTRSTRSGSTRSGRSATTRTVGTSRPLARPALPTLDPLAAIVPGTVPERKRFCSGCDAQLKREAGFCPKCGQEYSFVPSLKEGDLVLDKYEIKGTLAFGGLGWIYLALDTVLTRWVTMKGLLNSKDPRMLEVAVAEREFLASVKHPNIVQIFDFITHGDQGFIVMEYVNGKTLMTLRKERGGPLPVAEACSYIAEILPAFDYLDQQGLVYCDFKPENVMVEEETVKLIDMGAVRREEETSGDIYGSKGYTAPEAHDAPTPVSDLYSVGRALAVLVASFDFQGKYETSLPPRDEIEVFQKNEALYRFLVKATRPKPEERFQTAAEMHEQLVGVIRSIVGESPEIGHLESSFFAPDSDRDMETASGRSGRSSDGVPKLRVDPGDQGASVIVASSAVSDPERRLAMFKRALKQYPDSFELKLRVADTLTSLGRAKEAEEAFDALEKEKPNDWRVRWYRARLLLATGDATATLAAFEALAGELPGELAPQQAIGIAYEKAGDLASAMRYYDAVSRADASFASASLRLAKCCEKNGDKPGAIAGYRRVPSSSSRFPEAQMALARLLITGDAGNPPAIDVLVQASEAIESLDGLVDGLEAHRLRADLLAAAADAVSRRTKTRGGDAKILGLALEEVPLRTAAEDEYRQCAKQAKTDDARIALVDRANEVRPLTVT